MVKTAKIALALLMVTVLLGASACGRKGPPVVPKPESAAKTAVG